MWYISLAVFLAIVLVQLLKQRKNEHVSKKIFQWAAAISGIVIVGVYAYLTYAQYNVWTGDEFTKLLLPPYQSITYLLQVHFFRFFIYYGVSFLVALCIAWMMEWANRKHGGRFFEKEEKYIAGTAIFLLGDPEWRYAWLVYLCVVVTLYALTHLISAIYHEINGKGNEAPPRIPLYFFWIPTAIAVIIVLKSISFAPNA